MIEKQMFYDAYMFKKKDVLYCLHVWKKDSSK